MSRDLETNDEPITGLDDLVDYFESAAKDERARGVGTEHEKFGYDAETLEPLPYGGERGIRRVLEEFVERYGWSPSYDQGRVMALERDGAAITLEPGGQLELSGKVTRTVFETKTELEEHRAELRTISDALGLRWCGMGSRLWEDLDDVPWMPKSRYGVMKRYLPTRGSRAHWMMKMTCTIQGNFDYRDEEDAVSILRLGVRMAPLVTALFAASPVLAGRSTGSVSEREVIWTDTDPDRSGIPSFYLDGALGFREYIEWALDVPMFFIRRDGSYLNVAGRSFRSFVEDGLDGHEATLGDWELHLSTLFPSARLKRYIEFRTADGGDAAHVLALSALWKGIIYDDDARREAASLPVPDNSVELRELFDVARREGLDGRWRGRSIRELAESLVTVSRAGLDRQAGDGPSESTFLDALRDLATGALAAPAERIRALCEEADLTLQMDRERLCDELSFLQAG